MNYIPSTAPSTSVSYDLTDKVFVVEGARSSRLCKL